jgi:hypothetical protein
MNQVGGGLRRAVRRVLVTALAPWVHCPSGSKAAGEIAAPAPPDTKQAPSRTGSECEWKRGGSTARLMPPPTTNQEGRPLRGPPPGGLTHRGLLMEEGLGE